MKNRTTIFYAPIPKKRELDAGIDNGNTFNNNIDVFVL